MYPHRYCCDMTNTYFETMLLFVFFKLINTSDICLVNRKLLNILNFKKTYYVIFLFIYIYLCIRIFFKSLCLLCAFLYFMCLFKFAICICWVSDVDGLVYAPVCHYCLFFSPKPSHAPHNTKHLSETLTQTQNDTIRPPHRQSHVQGAI